VIEECRVIEEALKESHGPILVEDVEEEVAKQAQEAAPRTIAVSRPHVLFSRRLSSKAPWMDFVAVIVNLLVLS
jgi:hypothetical protein